MTKKTFLLPFAVTLLAGCEGAKTVEVTQLAIVNMNPSNGATTIGTDVDVTVTFSETVRAETVNGSSFCLRTSAVPAGEAPCASGTIPAVVSYDPFTLTARLVPADPLDADTLYSIWVTVSLAGTESGELPANVKSGFRTAP